MQRKREREREAKSEAIQCTTHMAISHTHKQATNQSSLLTQMYLVVTRSNQLIQTISHNLLMMQNRQLCLMNEDDPSIHEREVLLTAIFSELRFSRSSSRPTKATEILFPSLATAAGTRQILHERTIIIAITKRHGPKAWPTY